MTTRRRGADTDGPFEEIATMTIILAKALHALKLRRPRLATAVRAHDQAARQCRKAAAPVK